MKDEELIEGRVDRLLTMTEIFGRFPKAYFIPNGELIYNKEMNYYILPERFHELGTVAERSGWNGDLWLNDGIKYPQTMAELEEG